MQLKPFKRAPLILALAVLIFVCGLRLLNLELFDRLENITYDLRARAALHFRASAATNIAFVFFNEAGIAAVKNGYLDSDPAKKIGFQFDLYWPRQVYGRLVDELSAQGAKTIAFDVLFNQLRVNDAPVAMADGSFIESDDYFALQMRRAKNVILCSSGDSLLPDLFVTNALALGDATTVKDFDGVLRRVKAFEIYRHWHRLFQRAAKEFNLDLTRAKIFPGKIILPQIGTTNTVEVSVDGQNNFAVSDFVGGNLPADLAPKAKAFTQERVWQMGIVLAAQELNLDLSNAEVDLARGKIILHGEKGMTRTIPVDRDGYFFVDWRIKPNDPRLSQMPIENLLAQNFRRLNGETNDFNDSLRGKLVVIGSAAQGNDLTDRGATPLQRDTLYASTYWNVANSVIENQFIRRASLPLDIALIVLLGALAAFFTWQLSAFSAAATTFLFALIYITVAFYVFIQFRLWLPLFFPIAGAMLVEHLMIVAYRAVFEEGEKRRVKSVFSKIVAPDIVDELLQTEKLSLGGGRREISVYFADVRGFTEFTDQSQAKALELIREHNLSGAEAEKIINEEAQETLNTVNLYLGTLADIIKRHNGTLDKYIGDCVMAFWNAPVANEKHALCCIRAAIDAQRAIYQINLHRVAENHKRELEITFAGGEKILKPKLPVLMLGSGVNTGIATVGLMGSSEHLFNYTAFGREVNLASRLEAVSGRGRIIISEATYEHLKRDDPKLAESCAVLPPVKVKGIVAEIKIYEVPWRPADASPFDEELFGAGPTEGTSFTGITRKF